MKLLALLLALASGLSAQMFPFPGPGRAPVSTTFTGLGDVIPSNQLAGFSLRAWSAATRGTRAFRLCDAGDAHCADVVTNATTGAPVVPASNPNCTSAGACTVSAIYDQTGLNKCGGTCDMLQATEALRPTFNPNSGKPFATFTANQLLESSTLSQAQPFSILAVGERTGGFTSFSDLVGSSATAPQMGFDVTANNAFMYATGGIPAKAAADNAFHSIAGMFNSTSSILSVDGSASSVSTGTADYSGVTMTIGKGNNGFIGNAMEWGWFTTDVSTSFAAASANQHGFWGF